MNNTTSKALVGKANKEDCEIARKDLRTKILFVNCSTTKFLVAKINKKKLMICTLVSLNLSNHSKVVICGDKCITEILEVPSGTKTDLDDN